MKSKRHPKYFKGKGNRLQNARGKRQPLIQDGVQGEKAHRRPVEGDSLGNGGRNTERVHYLTIREKKGEEKRNEVNVWNRHSSDTIKRSPRSRPRSSTLPGLSGLVEGRGKGRGAL